MFWNKKEKKETRLPDLPPAPGRQSKMQLPSINPDQPEFGEPQINSKQIQEMDSSFESMPITRTELPELPGSKMPKTRLPMLKEEDEIIPAQVRIPESNEQAPEQGPIFVRLDKFKSSKKSLENIKEKLMEIEELLKKTREIKDKEEQEIEFWEKELQALKTRIHRVTEDIFEKVE